jgi:hypothetical protein
MRQLLMALSIACLTGCASQPVVPIEPDGGSGTMEYPPASLDYAPAESSWEGRVVALTRAWPVSTYTVLDQGHPVGRMTLRQSIVEEGGDYFALLEDAARVADPTGETPSVDYTYTSLCRLDDHLTPVIIEAQAPVREDTPTWSRVDVHEGRATGTTFESRVELDVPQRFVIRQGLMRLVGLLPREVGTETRLSFLSLGADPRVEKGRAVRCSGHEELELGKQRVMAWRFEYQSDESGSPHAVSLWVGDDGRFLRFHDKRGLQLKLIDA